MNVSNKLIWTNIWISILSRVFCTFLTTKSNMSPYPKEKYSHQATCLWLRKNICWSVCINWWKYIKNMLKFSLISTPPTSSIKIWSPLIRPSTMTFWPTSTKCSSPSSKKWSKKQKNHQLPSLHHMQLSVQLRQAHPWTCSKSLYTQRIHYSFWQIHQIMWHLRWNSLSLCG